MPQYFHFPLLAAPFFGRQQELRDVVQQLTTPSCRLLTLLGIGGAGKTRLALRAGQELLDHFPDGAWLVVLPPGCTTAALLAAIAETLGLRRAPGGDPMAVLLAQLAPKAALLILDNGEHLSGQASVAFLAELLQRAPDLTLLATSRVALQLREEWLYSVGGLPIPPAAEVEDVDQYAALQLFEASARRASSSFSLAAERAAVVEICRLVEGVPLAVELAAGWRHLLPCQAIAQEIARSISFLQSDLRDMPERHRSIRAVFDQSWQLLSPDERQTLQQLSVFRGSFGREAAGAVAGAVLPMLSALTRTSLIQLQPDGRYHLHELVRHYAAEQFGQSALTATVAARDRHCFYYLRFLAERSAAMNGHKQLQARGRSR
jgi:predicted ATPase